MRSFMSARVRPHAWLKAKRGSARYFAIPLVLAIGSLLSVSAQQFVAKSEHFELEASLGKAARERAELLQSGVLRSVEVLESVAALFVTHEQVSRDEFRAFVSDALRRHPELQALGWSPVVKQAERVVVEASGRREGIDGF